MSDRLLGLTVIVVLLAEVLFFLPLASSFRSGWLMDRIQAARLVVLGVESAEDMMVSEEVGNQMLETAGILAVRINHAGMSEIILPAPVKPGTNKLVDLRNTGFLLSLWQTVDTLFAPQPEYLRLVAQLNASHESDLIEVMVRSGDLHHELIVFSARTFWYSLAVSMATGAVLYLALSWIVVKPMERLRRDMTRFSSNPEDPTRVIQPGKRSDEIGAAEQELARLQAQVLEALRQKTRLAALGEAVSKINHDQRNILSSAQLVSDRLAMSDDPSTRTMGERLVRSIDRGVALCQSVLDFARPTSPECAGVVLNLKLVLEDAWLDVGDAAYGIEWVNTVDMQRSVIADPDSLYRVFLNLLRNSAEAMEGNGAITVATDADKGFLTVSLSDTGPGIPQAVQDRLFAPFSSKGKKTGTGLGLAIARELARAQGGDLVLGKTGTAGTTFLIKLPAA